MNNHHEHKKETASAAETAAFIKGIFPKSDVPVALRLSTNDIRFYHKRGRFYVSLAPTQQRNERNPFLMHAAMTFADPQLTYVQGFRCIGRLVVEHAWCIDNELRVHDAWTPSNEQASAIYYGVPMRPGTLLRLNDDHGMRFTFFSNLYNAQTPTRLFRAYLEATKRLAQRLSHQRELRREQRFHESETAEESDEH